jgi:hypothetical protein
VIKFKKKIIGKHITKEKYNEEEFLILHLIFIRAFFLLLDRDAYQFVREFLLKMGREKREQVILKSMK